MLYSELCGLYQSLENTSKRLEKTQILSDFLKKLNPQEDKVLYLIQGRVFPDYDERELGISTQLAIKALVKSSGLTQDLIIKSWKKLGDLGLVAEVARKSSKQHPLFTSKLTPEKVLENLRKLPELEGKGTVEKKLALISELLTSSLPIEAKYLIRTLIGDLRIGCGEGVIRDSIAKTFSLATEKIQEAYDKSLDFAEIFDLAKNLKLDTINLSPGKPVKVMLYPKASSIEEAFETVGKPAAFEFKYDGFRVMINKEKSGNIKIFTRRLENVTNQFPDVVRFASNNVQGESFIIDCEAVGYSPKTKLYTPFQDISQRIKRKYSIQEIEKKLPIELEVFDVIYYEGRNLINTPFQERRKLLEKIIKPEKYKIKLAEQIITDNQAKAQDFFEKALKENQEGVMAKSLSGIYKPGARVGYGVKIKPQDKDFDLIITGAEFGNGKRAGWLTSFDVSCRDKENLLEIGKVSTGLKEKEEQGLSFKEMTKLLKPLTKEEQGKHIIVKPEIVVSVIYQNIQSSPSYSSGYALRFPRITRLRPDRSVKDIASLDEIKKEVNNSNQ